LHHLANAAPLPPSADEGRTRSHFRETAFNVDLCIARDPQRVYSDASRTFGIPNPEAQHTISNRSSTKGELF